jgi:outer membrane protein insertion porin family
MKRLLLTAVLAVLMIAEVHAESFTISDIRVNGLSGSPRVASLVPCR